MNRIAHVALALLACAAPLLGEEADEAPETVAGAETPVPAAPAQSRGARTNAPPPALVGIALTAATGAWILSGVDWTSDDADASAGVLAAPSLAAPAADAEIAPGPVVFRWKAVKGAESYLLDVDVCAEPGVCSDFRLERVFGLSFAVEWPADAPAGRWRVRAVDADNLAGRWSEFRSFTRGPAAE